MDVRYEVLVTDQSEELPTDELEAIVEDGLDVNDITYENVKVSVIRVSTS